MREIMTLDENSDYKLTKVSSRNLSSPYVKVGDSITGHASLANNDTSDYILVTRGFQFIATSEIKNITTEDNITFKIETLNSTYTLEKKS
jgi:hypothetical protein